MAEKRAQRQDMIKTIDCQVMERREERARRRAEDVVLQTKIADKISKDIAA